VKRRAFTLLETMLAAGIGSVVVLACVAIMYSMQRTDRMMESRAEERAALGRIRTVMERTFSSLLMSDEPQSLYNPEASDAEETGQFNGRLPTNRRTNTAGNNTANGTSGKTPGRTPSTVAGGDTKAGENASAETPREPRVPPLPRMILGLDTNAPLALRYQPSKDLEAVDIAPQRLEVVLHRSPVPQATIDPLEMPLPPRSYRRNRSSTPEEETEGGRNIENVGMGNEEAQEAAADAEAEDAALPVRAVRGVFELHPQPPRNWRAPGVPQAPAPDPRTGGYEATGLWELWWVPLPPPNSEGLELTRQEAMFSGLGRPFLVAGDLKYARWTAFFRRSKRADLISTWTSDLPAYIEMQVETASGLQSNWMFELDWASGPEVAKRPDTTGEAGSQTAQGTDESATGGTAINRSDRPTTRAGGGRTLGRPASKGGSPSPSRSTRPAPIQASPNPEGAKP